MGQAIKEKKVNKANKAVRVPGIYRGLFPFVPKRAFFEPGALEYSLGIRIMKILKELGTEVSLTGTHNRVTGIPGKTAREAYLEAKRTLVVGVRKTLDFQTCKPSAHFQLPIVTSCPGMCEYCYLNTTLGKKPYVRVYVNIDEILGQAAKYISSRQPEITVFEGAATSDPLPVEPFTGALSRAIEFFGEQDNGRFRFVTKFTNVDSLLRINHRGHTRFRFSINARPVIDRFERGTPRLAQRLDAAEKAYSAAYPTGFIVAPVIMFEGWQDEYRELFTGIRDRFGAGQGLTFEVITHRFTRRAKSNILEIFPETALPMEEEERKFKYGQFGYGKYVYVPEDMASIKTFFYDLIGKYVPRAQIEYFI
ncbi:MAG: spore photoproduct lyase [Firmicutes bacterium HGW-Firmicutes-14]|nr:MAG: spore photoproduct lyase [Firmicutes bacterium HGW-Firmicutes-14]